MTIAKKGREYLVAITQLERTYKTRFKKGDIVIALEDDDVPYCILKEDFNGSYDEKDYAYTICGAMIYGEDIVEIEEE